jgi:DNA-binding MarR family transcriptional regulator
VSTDRDDAMRLLEHEIALLLRRVRKGIGERAVAIDPELNPTSYSLLLTLVDFGPRRAADLAEAFTLDKGVVSRAVRQLLDLGLVDRTPDPVDGRASILAASEEANRRFSDAADLRRRDFGRRLADWEPGEIDALAHGLARLNRTI